jgi:hypothetical protein
MKVSVAFILISIVGSTFASSDEAEDKPICARSVESRILYTFSNSKLFDEANSSGISGISYNSKIQLI